MILTGCWMVQHLTMDISDLRPKDRFDFGVFPVPNVTEETSEHFHTPLGSVGSVGMGFVISSTAFGQEQTAAVDWLRYLTSPEVVIELQGDATMLPCIHGVPIRPEMEGFRPLMDGTFPDLRIQEGRVFPDAESLDAWFSLFQSYMGGTLDLDDFSAQWKKECLAGVERTTLIEAYDTSKW
jgi:ABC-type glycerol-3-phosphate transport system substrate-binding protein